MSSPYLLDTNAYFLFFQHPKSHAYHRLINHIEEKQISSFYLSEITAMEIHSVLGKYRRGAPEQIQICQRTVVKDGEKSVCVNNWLYPGRKRMSKKVFKHLGKMIKDIESCRGDIRAEILSLDAQSIIIAKELLRKYADQFNFGSHDALIVGTLVTFQITKKSVLTMITSDRGMQNVLKEEKISFFDPEK